MKFIGFADPDNKSNEMFMARCKARIEKAALLAGYMVEFEKFDYEFFWDLFEGDGNPSDEEIVKVVKKLIVDVIEDAKSYIKYKFTGLDGKEEVWTTYPIVEARRNMSRSEIDHFDIAKDSGEDMWFRYFFREVSKMIAFDDVNDIDVVEIVYDGHKYQYAGWAPGMKYAYTDENGEVVWEGCFPEWDH